MTPSGISGFSGRQAMDDCGGFEWWKDEDGYCWHFAWETPLWFWLDGITVPRNTTPPVSGKA